MCYTLHGAAEEQQGRCFGSPSSQQPGQEINGIEPHMEMLIPGAADTHICDLGSKLG